MSRNEVEGLWKNRRTKQRKKRKISSNTRENTLWKNLWKMWINNGGKLESTNIMYRFKGEPQGGKQKNKSVYFE
jgi:hypothetical protein